MSDIVRELDAPINPNIPELRPGDTVSVYLRIMEGGRERVQEFRGTVIRLRKGGNNTNFTVGSVATVGNTVTITLASGENVVDSAGADVARPATTNRRTRLLIRIFMSSLLLFQRGTCQSSRSLQQDIQKPWLLPS